MRIVSLGPDGARSVSSFDSRGLRARPLVRSEDIAITVLHVAAGGEIGRHPAPSDQLFLVLNGSGAVSGGDGVWEPIAAGQAAIWSAGEEHATRADDDLTAVVVEMPVLTVVEPDL